MARGGSGGLALRLGPGGPHRGDTEQVALQAIDPERAQMLRLFGRFDGFGHGEHVEMLADGNQRGCQHRIVGVAVDVADELRVDLQDVEE